MNLSAILYLPVFGEPVKPGKESSDSENSQPFSLQSATYSYLTNPYALRIDGCQSSDGTRNCSRACASVDDIFATGSNFQNCLAYPLISQLLEDTNATSAIPAIANYSIIPGDTNGSKQIVQNVNTCLMGWASVTEHVINGKADLYSQDYCTSFYNVSNATSSFPLNSSGQGVLDSPTSKCLIQAFCGSVAASSKPSADIAGIGMYISYIMQIALVVLIWLVIEYFRILHPIITGRQQKHSGTFLHAHNTRQKEIFMESAIDFHKAQCYFIGTIMIAALIAANTNGLAAATLQDLFKDQLFLNILSIAGSLPVMFILLKLRLMGHKSFYTFMLSTCVFAVALALAFDTRNSGDMQEENLDEDIENLIPGCGNINPAKLCLSGSNDWQPGPGTIDLTGQRGADVEKLFVPGKGYSTAAAMVAVVFWLILLIDFLRETNKLKRFFTSLNRILSGRAGKDDKGERHHQIFWLRWAFGLLDFILCIGTLFLLIIYLRDLVFNVGYGSTRWTFGQLTALLVWIPPIVQYIYLQFHGAEGERWHLPDSLEVTRREAAEKSNISESNSQSRTRGRSNKNSVDLAVLGLDRRSVDALRTSKNRLLERSKSVSRARSADQKQSSATNVV